jgi:hypothetical protein
METLAGFQAEYQGYIRSEREIFPAQRRVAAGQVAIIAAEPHGDHPPFEHY